MKPSLQKVGFFKIVCDKFSKRRCVTFLAVDRLNPKCDEQQTAIRQLLRTFERTADKGSTFLPLVKPSDKCYKCGDEGHWAHQCKKDIPHDPEWLKKQQCYKCGEHGHLKNDCKAAMKGKEIKKRNGNNVVPKSNNSTSDPLAIQLLRLPEVDLSNNPKLVTLPCLHCLVKSFKKQDYG